MRNRRRVVLRGLEGSRMDVRRKEGGGGRGDARRGREGSGGRGGGEVKRGKKHRKGGRRIQMGAEGVENRPEGGGGE